MPIIGAPGMGIMPAGGIIIGAPGIIAKGIIGFGIIAIGIMGIGMPGMGMGIFIGDAMFMGIGLPCGEGLLPADFLALLSRRGTKDLALALRWWLSSSGDPAFAGDCLSGDTAGVVEPLSDIVDDRR
jgi:hypothetical protein